MKKQWYIVTAHHQDRKDDPFHIAFEAFTSAHAGAQFVVKTEHRGYSVIIERLVGEPIYLGQRHLPKFVVIDQIRRAF